jgi:hypothetical protein
VIHFKDLELIVFWMVSHLEFIVVEQRGKVTYCTVSTVRCGVRAMIFLGVFWVGCAGLFRGILPTVLY